MPCPSHMRKIFKILNFHARNIFKHQEIFDNRPRMCYEIQAQDDSPKSFNDDSTPMEQGPARDFVV